MKNVLHNLLAVAALLALLALLYLLLPLLLPRRLSETDLKPAFLMTAPVRDSLRVLSARSDTLKATLDHQHSSRQHIQSRLTAHTRESVQRMAATQALSSGQQVQLFHTRTGGPRPNIVVDTDTLIIVNLPQIREANRQFTALDTLTDRVNLLDTLLCLHDSLLTTHQTLQTTFEQRDSLLTIENTLLQ